MPLYKRLENIQAIAEELFNRRVKPSQGAVDREFLKEECLREAEQMVYADDEDDDFEKPLSSKL